MRSVSDQSGPWTYTVGAEAYLSETWTFGADGPDAFDLSVYGPNGFLRTFKGTVAAEGANLGVVSTYQVDAFRPGITLNVHNRGAAVGKVSIRDAYTGQTVAQQVEPGRSLTWHWSLEASFGWYDLTIVVESDSTFERRLAGHVETGSDSVSDPAIGA